MTRVFDLLKDDIIYGFCIGTQSLEVYQIDSVTITDINFHTLIGEESDFYLMFPKDLNLEIPVLCQYTDDSWWIYCTNVESLKNIMEADWEDWPDQCKRFYFDEYLYMWTQTMRELK